MSPQDKMSLPSKSDYRWSGIHDSRNRAKLFPFYDYCLIMESNPNLFPHDLITPPALRGLIIKEINRFGKK